MKKALLLLAFAVFLGWNVSAQQAHKHAINFGTTGLIGFAVGYERMLLSNFSLTVDAGAGLFLSPIRYLSIGARWYPISGSDGETIGLFMSGSIGYGEFEERGAFFGWEKGNDTYDIWGFMFSPAVGFKIGSNKPRGFLLTPMLGVDIILGQKTRYNPDGHDDLDDIGETNFGWGFNPSFKLLFGFAF